MNTSVLYTPGMTLDQLEKQVILNCYHFNQNNKTATAASLGISIRTLDNKLSRYKEDEKFEQQTRDDREQRRKRLLQEARGFAPVQEEASHPRNNQERQIAPHETESIEAPSEQEQGLPVQEREEVQKVLPRQVTNLGFAKRG